MGQNVGNLFEALLNIREENVTALLVSCRPISCIIGTTVYFS